MAIVINLLSHYLGWSDGRTTLTLVLFLVGLLFARNRIDRAANALTVLSRLGHHPQLLSPREVVAMSIGLDQPTNEAIRAAPARLFG